MEFKVIAIAVLALVVLLVFILLAINVSGILSKQVTNASSMLHL